MQDLTIRPWSDTDSAAALTEFLHAAYAELAAKGFRYSATYQDEARTLQRLRRGLPFLAEFGGELAGTITLYRSSPDSPVEWFRRPWVFHFGQFGVRPDLQRHGIGLRLYRHIEDVARRLGATEMALDTAEGAAHLRRWYEQLGFRFVQYYDWPSTNYRSVVLSKLITA